MLAILLLFTGNATAQSFEKIFSGQWAMTWWTFEFHKDGTYKRNSSGHYGNPEYKGNYYIQGDTLQILTGYENSHGTVNENYLLDGDSLLVDLDLLYDYKLNTEPWYYVSQKRYDILPKVNLDSIVTITRTVFDRELKDCMDAMDSEIFPSSNTRHIKIIRCYNTLKFSNTISSNSIYQEFMNVFIASDYQKKMMAYYDWIPNRGMGFYFRKLQIELMGTPHQFSLYKIIE